MFGADFYPDVYMTWPPTITIPHRILSSSHDNKFPNNSTCVAWTYVATLRNYYVIRQLLRWYFKTWTWDRRCNLSRNVFVGMRQDAFISQLVRWLRSVIFITFLQMIYLIDLQLRQCKSVCSYRDISNLV